MDGILEPPPRPRQPRWVWVAFAVALAVLVAGAGLVFALRRPPSDPGGGIAVVVFLEPDADDQAIAAYLGTLDVVGDVDRETHAQAYDQIVRLYAGGAVPKSIDADSVLESYRFRIATALDVEPVRLRLRDTPGVRDVVVPLQWSEPSPPPFDEARATELMVFPKQDATDAEKGAIEVYLRSLRTKQAVVFRTRAQAYQVFAAGFSDRVDLVRQTAVESLPEVFILSLVDAADISPEVARLKTFPGVETAVSYLELVSHPSSPR